ncbi:MAG: IS1634 family transposase [Saccharofermentanales bacterium]|jgi:transposase
MYLQKIPEKKSGRTLLTVVRSVWKNGKPSKQMVKRIGYVDEFTHLYDDPIQHFQDVVKEMTRQEKEAKAKITLTFTAGEALVPDDGQRKNIGYMVLSQLYEQLEIPRFMANRQRNLKIEFSLNAVLKLLVFSRTLFPTSKKQTYEFKDRYFEAFDFSHDDVYRSLSLLNRYADALKVFLHQQVCEKYGRRTDLVFYDVTNYYFEIEEQDDLRRKGVSKEHRPNPIVQMGLLMDAQGLPVTYELFSGNTNDCETLMPILHQVRETYDLERLIVVADRGLNTSNNIGMALAAGDGYIYGQSVLKASADLKAFCLDERGYRPYGSEDAGFKIKSRVTPKTIRVENVDGRLVDVSVDEKQVVFYSRKYAERARAMRQEAIDKALKLMNTSGQAALKASYGARKYAKGVEMDPETGELLETGTRYYLDEDKIREEALYDGYYAVVTSELDMPDPDVMNHYRGLWKIEESFRITKSELKARPIYVQRADHINAHFLTCFIALLLTRLVHVRTKNAFPVGQLLDAMRRANGTLLKDGYYVFDFYNDALKTLGEAFNIPFHQKFLNQTVIRTLKKPR